MTDENAEIREQLNQARKEGHFIFVPSPPIPQFKSLFVPVLAITKFTPDDFYPVSGGSSFGIHHAAAMRLANLAGIDWVSAGRMDDTKNPDYCLFRAIGRVRALDGLYQELSASKQLNVAEKRKSMIAKYETQFDFQSRDAKNGVEKWGKKVKPPWPKNKSEFASVNADKECNHLRETMVERCESGAQVRVIRAILGLPASFKKTGQNQHNGINKSFYIVRYILDPSRPDVQTIQLQALANANAGIYGMNTPAIEGPPMPKSLPMKDVTPKDELPPKKPVNNQNEQDNSNLDFENCSPEDQVRTIEGMIKDKNYPHYEGDMGGQPPLNLWNQEGRTEYFNHIRTWEAA